MKLHRIIIAITVLLGLVGTSAMLRQHASVEPSGPRTSLVFPAGSDDAPNTADRVQAWRADHPLLGESLWLRPPSEGSVAWLNATWDPDNYDGAGLMVRVTGRHDGSFAGAARWNTHGWMLDHVHAHNTFRASDARHWVNGDMLNCITVSRSTPVARWAANTSLSCDAHDDLIVRDDTNWYSRAVEVPDWPRVDDGANPVLNPLFDTAYRQGNDTPLRGYLFWAGVPQVRLGALLYDPP